MAAEPFVLFLDGFLMRYDSNNNYNNNKNIFFFHI